MPEESNQWLQLLATGGATGGGVLTVVWYFIKRLITRLDKIEDILTSNDVKNPGLVTMMALNISNDENFVKRFDEHLKTHTGIKEEVREMLEKFKKDLFDDLDRRYKQR